MCYWAIDSVKAVLVGKDGAVPLPAVPLQEVGCQVPLL